MSYNGRIKIVFYEQRYSRRKIHISEYAGHCQVSKSEILFPSFVNDMHISVDCKVLSYADYSVLLVSGKDPKIVTDR